MSVFDKYASKGMTLSEAVKLLEVQDIASLQLGDLPTIKKRAMRRWHPDRIAHQKPEPSLLAEYESNFKKIDEAIHKLNAYLDGDVDAGPKKKATSGSTIEPEEAVRKYAAQNQQRLKERWPNIKGKPEYYREEDVVLTEGISLREALDSDLEDRLPGTAIGSLIAGTSLALCAGLATAIVEIFSRQAATYFSAAWALLWLTQVLACLVVLIPLSRFWIPFKLFNLIAKFVDWPLDFIMEGSSGGIRKYIAILIGLLSLAVHYLLATPLYWIAKQFFGDRMIGKNIVKMRYYAGFSEKYVNRLANEPIQGFSLEELFDLSHAASAFTAR
jgi:hypothetical protein